MIKKVKRIALIDADIVLYKACMTAEYTVYLDPENSDIAWRYKKLVPKEHQDRLIAINVVCSPEEAVEAFDKHIHRAIRATNATHYILFTSPKKNFRHRVAETLPYKGNRQNAKPTYFEFLTRYTKDEYGLVECQDIEADDGLGIMQTHFAAEGISSVICSDDKDLKMIPGDHYNLRTFEQEVISKAEGNHRFAIQLLVGDSTDNIQGLTRVGVKTAEKILDGVSPEKRIAVIQEKYAKQFKEKAEARFKENVKLLKILRKVPKGQDIEFYNQPIDVSHLNMSTGEASDGFSAQ